MELLLGNHNILKLFHTGNSAGNGFADGLVIGGETPEVETAIEQQPCAQLRQDSHLGTHAVEPVNATVAPAHVVEHGFLRGGLLLFVPGSDQYQRVPGNALGVPGSRGGQMHAQADLIHGLPGQVELGVAANRLPPTMQATSISPAWAASSAASVSKPGVSGSDTPSSAADSQNLGRKHGFDANRANALHIAVTAQGQQARYRLPTCPPVAGLAMYSTFSLPKR